MKIVRFKVHSLLYDCLPRYSDITTSTTQGRVICRLISMFDSVDGLVDEYDRRRALETDMTEEEETPE